MPQLRPGDPARPVLLPEGRHAGPHDQGQANGPVIGVIRSTFVVGPEGTIERAWYGVTADGHAAEVLKALDGPA